LAEKAISFDQQRKKNITFIFPFSFLFIYFFLFVFFPTSQSYNGMANPRKRKNDADHGSMKINRFFKPIQNTVVPTPSKTNNDENLPPKGQSVENKRAFGQQSLVKKKPVKAPLRDRNPEVRISASHNTQSNHAPFTILKDDDIKKGVMKVSQFEPKDPIQSSQPSSQPESTHSSQSSCTQKDDFVSKIKPRKLFSVYNDSQEEEEDDEQGHSQQEESLTNRKPFAVFTDETDSQTTNSQQKKTTTKQKPFSIFMDNQDDNQDSQTSSPQKEKPFSVFFDDLDDDQDRQTSCSQQENTVSKQKPFSVFMDNSDDENGSSQPSRLQKKSTLKEKPFSVFMDNENSQPDRSQKKTCPKEKPFSIFMDNLDDGGDENNQAEPSQERNILKEKPFSVFMDNENSQPDCSQKKTCPKEKPFSIFMDNPDDGVDDENCQTKPSQERNALKKKPFSVLVDDENNQPDCSQPEKSSPKQQEPFSIIVDNVDDDGNSIADSQDDDSTEAPFSISMDESSQSNSTPQDDTTERKPFAVLVDNRDDKRHHSDPTLFSQEKPSTKKKLFSIYVDDTLGDSNPQPNSQREEAAPKNKFFSIFKDAEETKNTKNRLPVYNENKPPVHTVYNDENEPPREETRVYSNDAFWDDDDDDLDTFLTHTRRDDTRLNEENFFSDDEGSDSYSEVQLLHNDTFSTTFDPLTIEERPAESNDTSRTNSFMEPEAGTLEFACPDGPEEVHVAYPNPRGDSLDDKLDLKKD
jgi:hypothetical protein